MSVASALDNVRRRKVRRTAVLLGLIAAAFYVGFIIMAVLRATS